jgi:hypothetical protein
MRFEIAKAGRWHVLDRLKGRNKGLSHFEDRRAMANCVRQTKV